MHLDRDTLICQHLYAHAQCTIQELAELTEASVATVRRDLQRLEEKGIVERTHGGARIASGAGLEVAFEAREQHNIVAKRAIAAAAFALVRPGMTVFLDAGTTVLQFARYLRLQPQPITVFTNSLAVAQLLVGVSPLKLTLLGGELRAQNLSAVGPIAEAALNALWFDQLFLGASAIRADGTLSTPDSAEASLNARMLQRATRRSVLADSSKFGLSATYKVAALDEVSDLISDSALSTSWRARLEKAGVNTIIAAPDSERAELRHG